MNEMQKARIKDALLGADSITDKLLLWLASLPTPWTTVTVLGIVIVLLATRWVGR